MTPHRLQPETAILAFAWLCLAVFVFAVRPAMPVDETRYLTVAWEMWHSGNYLVPHLNYAAYSHKPPLLFWLVNAAWHITGAPSLEAARMVPFVITGLFLGACAWLGRLMAVRNTAMLVMASPLFLVYTTGLAFDTLMGLWSVVAVIALVHAARGHKYWPWLLFTLCLGLGALTKGPVILVYTLPPALLAPYWAAAGSIRKAHWYAALAGAVAGGFAIGLAWALPAALAGGKAYGDMLLWGQTAGRMVNAFDHVRPFWFYLPFACLYLVALLAWPALWRGVCAWRANGATASVPLRLALCWFVPVFVAFSLISSKQVHYLVPVIPPAALAMAYFYGRACTGMRGNLALPFIVLGLPSVALLAEYTCARFVQFSPPGFMALLGPWYAGVAAMHVAVICLLYTSRRVVEPACLLATAVLFTVTAAYGMSGSGLLSRYDLRPAAAFLETQKTVAGVEPQLAVFPKYQGELGFTARLTRPVDVLKRAQIQPWLDRHPDGLVIMRETQEHGFDPELEATLLYSQRYRNDEEIHVIRAAGPSQDR